MNKKTVKKSGDTNNVSKVLREQAEQDSIKRVELFEKLNDKKYVKSLQRKMNLSDIEHVTNKEQRHLTIDEKKKIIDEKAYYTSFGKANVPYLYELINRGLFIVGGIGAGKTVAMNQITHGVHVNGVQISLGIKDLNEAMWVYVRKESDFVGDLYRKGLDIKLGSKDYDAKHINFVAGLRQDNGKADKKMCKLFAKTGIAGDGHFEKQAVICASAFLEDIAEIPKADNKILMDTILAVTNSPEQLLEYLENSATVRASGNLGRIRGALTADENKNMDGQGSSVFATLNDFFSSLVDEQFYYESQEDDFVHKDYILKQMNQNLIRRRVFLMNTTDSDNNDFYTQINIQLIFKYGLALKQDQFDRMWMLMDEIQSVASSGNEKAGKFFLQEYTNFMAESRSYGWCHIAGTQSISRLESILDSKFNRRQFYQMFTTKYYMKYNEPEDLEYVVKDFGTSKIKKTKENLSIGEKMEGDRVSQNEEEKVENIIEANEIGTLPNLSGYLKMGIFPPAFVQYDYWKPAKIHTRIRGLDARFDIETNERHYHDTIIQKFKKVLSEGLIELNLHNFSYEKYKEFSQMHYKTQLNFFIKLERVCNSRAERLAMYLPFLFEAEIVSDFADKVADSELYKNTDELHKIMIEETGLYSLNRNIRLLKALNKNFEVQELIKIEMDAKGKEKQVKYKKVVILENDTTKKKTATTSVSNAPVEQEIDVPDVEMFDGPDEELEFSEPVVIVSSPYDEVEELSDDMLNQEYEPETDEGLLDY